MAQPARLDTLRGIAAVAAGPAHTVIITEERRVFVCGDARYHQLGLDGDLTVQTVPVEMLSLPPCVAAACGACHTVFLTVDGEARSYQHRCDERLPPAVGACLLARECMCTGPRWVLVAQVGRRKTIVSTNNWACISSQYDYQRTTQVKPTLAVRGLP